MFSRLPLPLKILLWFFLNLALLLAGFFLIFSAEYRFNLDWIFSSHAQQRVDAMRDLIVDDLDSHAPDEWDDVIERFADAYHVHLGLFDDHGRRLLGSVDDLPAEVRLYLRPAANAADGNPAPATRAFIHTDAPTRYWLIVGARVENARTGGPLLLHVVAESVSASMGGLVIDPAPWLRLGAAAVVCSVLFWLPLLRGITRSIGQVTHAAREIAEGRLDAPGRQPPARRTRCPGPSDQRHGRAARRPVARPEAFPERRGARTLRAVGQAPDDARRH